MMVEPQAPGNFLERQSLVKTPAIKIIRPIVLYKAIAINTITVIFAFLFSYFLRGYFEGTMHVLYAFGALLFFCTFSVLCIFLTKDWVTRSIALFLEALGLISFFYDQDTTLIGILFVFLIILFFWGEIAARRELKETIHIRFYRIGKLQLRRVVMGVVLMTVLLYLPQWAAQESFISQGAFRVFFDWTGGITKNIYPDLNFTSTFRDLLDSFIRTRLREDVEFQRLDDPLKEELITQKIKEISDELRNREGIAIQENEPANDAFYQIVINMLRGWREQYGVWFVIAWGIGLFLAIQSAGFVFQSFALFISFIFFQLFIAMNLIHIVTEMHSREIVDFS